MTSKTFPNTDLGDTFGSYVMELLSAAGTGSVTFTNGGVTYNWHPTPMSGPYTFTARNNSSCVSACTNQKQYTSFECFNFSSMNQELKVTFHKWTCTVSSTFGPKSRLSAAVGGGALSQVWQFWQSPGCSRPADDSYDGEKITVENPGGGVVCTVMWGTNGVNNYRQDLTTFPGW